MRWCCWLSFSTGCTIERIHVMEFEVSCHLSILRPPRSRTLTIEQQRLKQSGSNWRPEWK
jgi:hypothetical protein